MSEIAFVWVTQFHNGGNFYPTGKSMAKFSIMYETVNSGVSSVQTNFHNIPVNLFSKSINELLNNDIIEIPDYKDETIATYGLKYIAQLIGLAKLYQETTCDIDIPATNKIGTKNIALFGCSITQFHIFFIIFLI